MSDERAQAELLDRAVDQMLEHNRDTLTERSRDLGAEKDVDMTSMVRELRAVAESTPIRSDFLADLEEQLLGSPGTDTIAVARPEGLEGEPGASAALRSGRGRHSEADPGTVTGTGARSLRGWWSRRRRDSSQDSSRNSSNSVGFGGDRDGHQAQGGSRWVTKGIGLAWAMVILLALATAVLMLTRPQSLTTTQILARTEQAASNADGSGPRSYHALISGDNGPSPAAGAPMHWEQEEWFQAPDRLRVAFTGTLSYPITPSVVPDVHYLTIENGHQGWRYDGQTGQSTTFDPTSLAAGGTSGRFTGATDLQSVLLNASRDYDARLVGTEQIAGHSTYVLQLTPKPGTELAKVLAQGTIWIDQKTYRGVAGEWRDAQGEIITRWTVTGLEEDPGIDPSLFVFKEPPEPTKGPTVTHPPPTTTQSVPSDVDTLAGKSDVVAQVRVFLYNQDGEDATLGLEVEQWLKTASVAVTNTKTLFLRVPSQLWNQMPNSFKSTSNPAGNYGKNDTYVMFLNRGPADPTYGELYYLTGRPQGAFLVVGGKIADSAFPQYKGMPLDDFKRLITGEPTPVPTVAAQDTATRVPGSSPVNLAREGDGFRLDVYDGAARFGFGHNLQSPWVDPSRLLVEWYSTPATPTDTYTYTYTTYLLDTAKGQLITLPNDQPDREVYLSPDGRRAAMVWENSTLRIALYDFASGAQQTVADIDPGVPQWAGPDTNLSEFKPGTDVFVYATVAWAGDNSFALTLSHDVQAGEEYKWDKALLVDIAQHQVRVLANRGIVVGTFPDGSVLFRSGRIDGAIQLYRPGDKSITTVAPSGPWTTGWSVSPDGKKAAWLEMTPPPGDWSKRLPNECCSGDPIPEVKDIVVFDLSTGQTRRFEVAGFAWNSPDAGWMQLYKLRWSNDGTALFCAAHLTENRTTLYRLSANGQTDLLVEIDKRVGINVVAEGNDGSIYYMVNGVDCQNCSQLMRHTADGKTEVVHANGIPYDWRVDSYGHLEEIKNGGVLVTDLVTGQSHRVYFPGEKVDSGQLGMVLDVGALVPISPDGNWAAYAGSQSDAVAAGDRGKTVRVVRIK